MGAFGEPLIDRHASLMPQFANGAQFIVNKNRCPQTLLLGF